MNNGNESTKFHINEKQEAIVKCAAKVCRVIAGAGTGKTTVLLKWLIHFLGLKGKTAAGSVLLITFTNRAVNELTHRLEAWDRDVNVGWLCTIHAFCHKFLLEEIHVLNRKNDFSLIDDWYKDNILKLIYSEDKDISETIPKDNAINFIKLYKFKGIISEGELDNLCQINNLSRTLLENKVVRQLASKYENYLQKNNLLDFEDLLIFVYRILDKNENIRKKWQQRFQCILFDEFQDIDQIQYKILTLLVGEHCRLFVVGDPDQAIYSWRNSVPEAIQKFPNNFKEEIVTLVLDQNYRSSPKILKLANDLIKHNTNRIDKKLITDNDGSNNGVFYHKAFSRQEEADWIADQIHKLVVENGEFKYEDIAVLYRKNNCSSFIRSSLEKKDIPNITYVSLKYSDNPKIKIFIDYFRAAILKDDANVLQAITFFISNVNKTKNNHVAKNTVAEICNFANLKHISIYEMMTNHQQLTLPDEIHTSLDNLLRHFTEIRTAAQISLRDMISAVKNVLQESLKDISKYLKLLNGFLTRFLRRHPKSDAKDFLAAITLANSLEPDKESGVKLSTIHSAKGLEFPCVFLAGLYDGTLPDHQCLDLMKNNPDQMKRLLEEERRLMYVGITRAKRRLYLTSCSGKKLKDQTLRPSRFISELSPDDFEEI